MQPNNNLIATVKGVGDFEFKQRTMLDEFSIQSKYSELTGGVKTPTEILDFYATAFSTIKVLTVVAPDNWDIDSLDPFEEESFTKINNVYTALVGAEDRFRESNSNASKESGAEVSGEPGALVPETVQSQGE